MDRPASLSDMAQQDETVHNSSPKGSGFETGKPLSAISNEELNAARKNHDDPLSRIVKQDSDVPGFYTKPRPKSGMTGTIDPIFGKAGFAIGDKIYRSKNKAEGVVKDVAASGKVLIKLEGYKPNWVEADTIVKI